MIDEHTLAKLHRLGKNWERIAAEHGVRQFTGNDHLLFANELHAIIGRADGTYPPQIANPNEVEGSA